jgi:hypothetical protein
VPGLDHSLQVAAHRAILGDHTSPHLCIPYDSRQDVVEIMSDPSGKGAYGFHLLGAVELLLQVHSVRDILGTLNDSHNPPLVISDTRGQHIEYSLPAARPYG